MTTSTTSSMINGVSMTEITAPLSSHLTFLHTINSPFSVTTHSPSFLFSSPQFRKSSFILKVSSEGVPSEVEEESKFVPLTDEEPSYGPPAVLLLGFGVEEADKIQQLLKDLEGDFLQVIYCTDDMISRPLWDAVSCKQQNLEKLKIAKSVPRICFLSGLTGEEMMMFIDAFEQTDLKPAVFAAHVPNSSSKPLQEIIEEVMGDHEMMSGDSEKP